MWRLVFLSAVVATAVLAGGLVLAVSDVLYPPVDERAGPPPAPAADSVLAPEDGYLDIVALGDSLTKGMGDPEGRGYIGRLKDKLAEVSDVPVRLLNNLAVNGYRTDQLLADLDKPAVIGAIKRADLIVFTIGGNDLFRYIREEIDVLSNTVTAEDLANAISEPAERLDQIMAALSAMQPDALVLVVGLYNPFLDLDETRETSATIADWNARANRAAYKYSNVLFVPVADLFERNLTRYLYTDHFHPNAEGYERMAERLFRALY